MHPWTRPDAIYTSLCRLRRLTNECRLEGDKTHAIFHFYAKKWGGGTFPMSHQAEKLGDASPPSPTDLRPWSVSLLSPVMKGNRVDMIV